MAPLSKLALATAAAFASLGSCINVPQGYGSINGYPQWAAGNWPPSNVGSLIVPQAPDQETVSMLEDFNPGNMRSYIQTLVNFGTRHTMSETNSTTFGIGAARQWLLKTMTTLAEPSNGKMKVSLDCYMQGIGPGITRTTEIVYMTYGPHRST